MLNHKVLNLNPVVKFLKSSFTFNHHIYSEFSGKREINVKNGSLLRVVGACSSIVIRTLRIRGLVVFGSTGSGGVDIGNLVVNVSLKY